MGFAADTQVMRDGDAITARLLPEWGIWGPNGGYMAAIALRAAGLHVAAGHRPVSLSVQYLGRAQFGPADIVVTPVKSGGSACFNIAMGQSGRTFLQAQLWTTSRNAGPVTVDAVMPEVPGPDGLETLAAYKARRGETEHPFWSHFEVRPIGFTGPPEPEPLGHVLRQWTRYLDYKPSDDVFLDAGRAAVLIDTLIWPAHWRGCAVNPDYAAPSLDLTVWFHAAAADADWLLADVRADTAGQGLIHGGVRLFAADGRLIASGGSQLLVVPNR